MKYYIYISDSKLDMLFDQIAERTRSKLATELKIDLKVVGASRKVESNYNRTRMSKLRLVTEYIRKSCDLGSVEEGKSYVEDTLEMRWGPVERCLRRREHVPIVYFGGVTGNYVVGLAGSRKHLLGGDATSSVESGSATPAIIGALSHLLEEPIPDELLQFRYTKSDRYPNSHLHDPLFLTQIATGFMEGAFQRISFLARTLVVGDKPDPDYHAPWGRTQERVWLGTPLWVALAD